MYTQNSFNHYMGQWLDMQKQMLDVWQDSFMPKASEETSTKSNASTKELQDPMEIFHQWSKTNYDFFANGMKLFMNKPMQNIFAKMANGVNAYQSIYEFWQDLTHQFTGSDITQIEKFYGKWQKEYMKNLSNIFIPYLPQPVQDLFNNPVEIYQMYFETNTKFWKPWLENSKDFQELIGKSLSGDKEAFLNSVKLWKENYEATFGRVFDFPIMGINREYFEKQVESMDSFMKYLNSLSEFSATLYRVGAETMEKIINNYHDMLQAGTQPKTFKEFYTYWWKQNEEAYKNLFKTDDFSKLLSQVVDAAFVFKKNFDKVMEQQLEYLPLPTKSDMNSLYETVYHLKKEIKTLNKEVSALTNKVSIQSTNA